ARGIEDKHGILAADNSDAELTNSANVTGPLPRARVRRPLRVRRYLSHTKKTPQRLWMAEEGVPMQQIAQYLGHSDSRTTERVYARFSPGTICGTLLRL